MSKTDEDDQDELDEDARVVKFLKLKCLQQNVCACARKSCFHNRKYWASFMFYSFKYAAPSDHFKYGTITAVARTLKLDADDVETMLRDVQQEVEINEQADDYTTDNHTWPVTAHFKHCVTRTTGYDDFDGLQTLSDLSVRVRSTLTCSTVIYDDITQKGVFALHDISCGQIVDVYLGRDVHRSHKRKDDIDNDKVVSYDNRLVIPDIETLSNYAHFINDCADGGFTIDENANVDFLLVSVTAKRKVVLIVSRRAIRKGEELLLNYGSEYWTTKHANGEAVYKPERILDESDEKDAYYVQWQHYPDDKTWERRSELQNCSVVDEWIALKKSK